MRLVELLDAANKFYPDGYLSEYYDEDGNLNKDGTGDSLARFIVIEIIETYDPEASDEKQQAEAIRVLQSGIEDLEEAIRGIEEMI